MGTSRRCVYDRDQMSNGGYAIGSSLEVDWSQGTSCKQHRKERQFNYHTVSKAYVKYPLGG